MCIRASPHVLFYLYGSTAEERPPHNELQEHPMIWNDGYRAPTPTPVAQAIADDDYDADYYPPCPICGDPCDYCPGHPRLDCGCWADLRTGRAVPGPTA